MVKFYLINLLNTLSFEKQAGFEYLPYEEGIKTCFFIDFSIFHIV